MSRLFVQDVGVVEGLIWQCLEVDEHKYTCTGICHYKLHQDF